MESNVPRMRPKMRSETLKTKLHNWLWLVCMLLIVTGAWPAHAFYNPTTGCWLSRDPIEEEGGINLLSFALGNPVSVIDVLGSAPRNEAIVVVVPSEPDGGYDTSEASFVLDVNKKKDRKGWLVFEVAGIKDANTKMAIKGSVLDFVYSCAPRHLR